MMEITTLGWCMGLLLLLVPAYILYALRIACWHRFLRSVAGMVVSAGVAGVVLYYLMRWDSVLLNVLWLLLSVAVATVVVLRRARLGFKAHVVPVGAGVLAATLVVGLYWVWLVLGVSRPFAARWFLPVTGLLAGVLAANCGQALGTYYAGLRHHDQLYFYLLGNGATPREAQQWFLRRAVERVALSSARQMGFLFIGTTPAMLWALLLAGTDVCTAVLLQLVWLAASFCASVVAVLVTILVARHTSFDRYNRLKDGFDVGQTV